MTAKMGANFNKKTFLLIWIAAAASCCAISSIVRAQSQVVLSQISADKFKGDDKQVSVEHKQQPNLVTESARDEVAISALESLSLPRENQHSLANSGHPKSRISSLASESAARVLKLGEEYDEDAVGLGAQVVHSVNQEDNVESTTAKSTFTDKNKVADGEAHRKKKNKPKLLVFSVVDVNSKKFDETKYCTKKPSQAINEENSNIKSIFSNKHHPSLFGFLNPKHKSIFGGEHGLFSPLKSLVRFGKINSDNRRIKEAELKLFVKPFGAISQVIKKKLQFIEKHLSMFLGNDGGKAELGLSLPSSILDYFRQLIAMARSFSKIIDNGLDNIESFVDEQ